MVSTGSSSSATRCISVGVVLQGSRAWIGGVEYTKNLLRACYQALDSGEGDAVNLIPVVVGDLDRELYQDMPDRFHEEVRMIRPRFRGRLPRWLTVGALGIDPTGTLSWAASESIEVVYPHHKARHEPKGARGITWIPDLQHRRLPQFFSERELAHRDRWYRWAGERADLLVFSSETARDDYLEFFKARPARTAVLRFATGTEPSWFELDPVEVQQKYGLPDRYFHVSNQFWKHKNHEVVLRSLGRLRRLGLRPTVVCTGTTGDYRHNRQMLEIDQIIKEEEISDQVRILGLLPRADQINIMRRSLAVLQPSLFEGWSTVVEDARSLGKTIGLSQIGVHVEQNPPYGVYFDPHKVQEVADLLAAWWKDLPPGPDTERESVAKRETNERTLAFGRCFLDIARKAAA